MPAGIDTPDPGAVVFRFEQPDGPLLQRLAVVEASIIPKHLYEGKEVDKDPANLKPIGTGPFRLVEYVKGDRIVLERNPDYFRPDRPYFDRAIYRIIPTAVPPRPRLLRAGRPLDRADQPPDGLGLHRKVTADPFDLAAANRALDATGLPRGADGTRFTVTFTYATFFARLGEALRDQLKGAGIRLELEALEANAANDKVFVKKEFDLGVASY